MGKHILFISFLWLLAGMVYAQQKMNVRGTVAYADGMEAKRTELSVLYTTISARANNKGVFTLKNVWANDTVRITIDRQKAALFPVRGKTDVRLSVQDDLLTVAYGTDETFSAPFLPLEADDDERSEMLITARIIERNAFRSLEQSLRGMVPGLTFMNSDEGLIVSMRGSNSLRASSSALVLINGAEVSFNDANNSLDVNDIESIQVNKDGMGYGLKGSGGVIVIKTKDY